jgi:hypothetical protein
VDVVIDWVNWTGSYFYLIIMKDLKESTLEDLMEDLVWVGRRLGKDDLDYIPDDLFDEIYGLKREITRRVEEKQ